MSRQQLKIRLYTVAVAGMKSARRNNPFWSTRQATQAVVGAFVLIRD